MRLECVVSAAGRLACLQLVLRGLLRVAVWLTLCVVVLLRAGIEGTFRSTCESVMKVLRKVPAARSHSSRMLLVGRLLLSRSLALMPAR
jgi:hypothetical protein